jgi:hypothetical protein
MRPLGTQGAEVGEGNDVRAGKPRDKSQSQEPTWHRGRNQSQVRGIRNIPSASGPIVQKKLCLLHLNSEKAEGGEGKELAGNEAELQPGSQQRQGRLPAFPGKCSSPTAPHK